MSSRTWIKLHCKEWLEGSLREQPIEFRGVWAGLLALAGDGRYGDSGEIKLSKGIDLTDRQISEILSIKLGLWRRVRRMLLDTNRIEITKKGAISIVNWLKYQSEYSRQKPYRETAKATQNGTDKYTKGRYGHMVQK